MASPGRAPIEWDIGWIDRVDIGTVDALARLALTARRLDQRLLLRGASEPLRELISLAGLTTILPLADSPTQTRRQAEQREEPGRVQEEGDPADPPV